jgi:hypothetical protein
MAPTQASPDAPLEGPGPTRSYALVLVVEVAVLIGLFWIGRHFG